MSTTIRELLVKLGVEADTDAIDKFDEGLGDLKDLMMEVVTAAAAVTAAVAAVVVTAAQAGDAVDEGAMRTGVSAEAYQELAYMAEKAGVGVEQLEAALGVQNKQVQAAIDKGQDYIETTNGVRIAISDASGEMLSQEELLYATADAIASAATEQDALAIATSVYGEAGAKLLPMLGEGSASMEAMAAAAHDLGIVMSDEQVAASVALSDALDDVWAILEGLRNTIGLSLMPIITTWLTRLRDWYTANSKIINQKLNDWLDVIVEGLESLADAAMAVNDFIERTVGWEAVFAAVATAAAAFGAAMAAVAALKVWAFIESAIAVIGTVGAATFGEIVVAVLAVVAAITALYLVVEDLITYFNGGDSAIGRFLDTFRNSDGVLGAAARRIEQIIAIGQKMWEVVQKLGTIWWEVFSRTTLPVLKIVGAALLWLAEQGLGALGWWWDNVVGPVFDFLLAGLDMVLAAIDVLQPKLEGLFAAMDAGLGALGGVLGLDLTMGAAAEGDTTAAAGDAAAASAAFAPSTGEVSSTSTTTGGTTNMEGNTYNITSSMTEDEVKALIASEEEKRTRDAAAVAAGGEM